MGCGCATPNDAPKVYSAESGSPCDISREAYITRDIRGSRFVASTAVGAVAAVTTMLVTMGEQFRNPWIPLGIGTVSAFGTYFLFRGTGGMRNVSGARWDDMCQQEDEDEEEVVE